MTLILSAIAIADTASARIVTEHGRGTFKDGATRNVSDYAFSML